MAGRFEGVSDLEWRLFEDVFPPVPPKRSRGMPHAPFRNVLNTLLYVLTLQRHLFTSACIFTGPKSWLSRPLYTACDGQDTLCGCAAGSAVSVPAPPAA